MSIPGTPHHQHPPQKNGNIVYMETLYDVSDYRDLLRIFYERRKDQMPLYSYRMMGTKLGLDGSQLFRIIHKEQHLPPRCVPLAKDLLGLAGRAGEYFELLIAAGRTRTIQKRKELLNKAFALRDVQRRDLATNELRFLSQWWFAAVRAYLEVNEGVANPPEIANNIIPNISEEQVREALELLKELGFVRKLASNRLSLAQTHLTVSGPEKAKAVRSYQKQVLQLASEALDNIPTNLRDVSTLTMAVDEDCFNDLREMTREFRRQLQKRVEESHNPDRVMQLNLVFFPVAMQTDPASHKNKTGDNLFDSQDFKTSKNELNENGEKPTLHITQGKKHKSGRSLAESRTKGGPP